MSAAVSIAIPTYNRAGTLTRAIESALAQTHEDLELLVCDDASTDRTAELLAELATHDDRVRVVRHPTNVGMVANLDAASRLAQGDHVMLLADDDRLAPNCVEVSLAALRERPERAAALGQVAYERDGVAQPVGRPAPLEAPDPARRVRDYFAAVAVDHGNSWLYGLARRDLVGRLSPLRDVLGFDWLRVAELAFCGPIAVLPETLVHRELGGVSETTRRNVSVSGLPSRQARIPHLVIGREVLADVGWRSPVYAPLGRRRRLALAAACAAGVPGRNARHVAFHLAPEAVQRRWHARA